MNYVTVIATQKLDESLLRIAGLFSSLGESAKLRGQIGGFPEKAPSAGLETGAPREN